VTFTQRAIAYLKPALPDDGTSALQLSREDSPILRPLVDGLLVCYAVDTGSEYQLVQQRHLDHERVDANALHRTGLTNLAELINQRETRVQPYGNIFAVMMGGDFEASLLLVDALWDQVFRQFVQGDYAAAVPARDVLAFCDAASAAGIDELRQLIARVYPGGDHLLTDRIYVRREARWQPL
jgi:uncharacterized protein YtpQ (UPF0354 family)